MIRDAVKRPHAKLPMPASVKKREAKAAPVEEAKVEG
jgi:hypothetical protein